MLPRDRAELIVAEHAGGKNIREIAEAHGHSITTIRDYVRGRRTPGEPAARDDEFVPYIAYCRRRLADDPHLRTPALLAELSVLGFDGSRATFYRALERHGIQTHPCPDCHPASMSGYSPPSPGRSPQPFPLPKPAAPVAGETLTSFLGRLAAVNRTSSDALLDILPHWFRVKARWHDDRWQPAHLIPWARRRRRETRRDQRLNRGSHQSRAPRLRREARPASPGRCRMPALHRSPRHPAAGPGPSSRSPAALHQARDLASRAAGLPQLDISRCPDILKAEKRARHAARQYSPEQMILAETQTQQAIAGPAPQPSRLGTPRSAHGGKESRRSSRPTVATPSRRTPTRYSRQPATPR